MRDAALPVQSEHMLGWVAYGMSMFPPENASREWLEGYREHRNYMLSVLSVCDVVLRR